MQYNPDYAALFRSRPLRFVLPLLKIKSNEISSNMTQNLNKLEDSESQALNTSDGLIEVVPEVICSIGCETPQINYKKYLGQKYQYFYAISSDVDIEYPGTIIKVDVKHKTFITWKEKNCYPSEPIFVPAPNSKVSAYDPNRYLKSLNQTVA